MKTTGNADIWHTKTVAKNGLRFTAPLHKITKSKEKSLKIGARHDSPAPGATLTQ